MSGIVRQSELESNNQALNLKEKLAYKLRPSCSFAGASQHMLGIKGDIILLFTSYYLKPFYVYTRLFLTHCPQG